MEKRTSESYAREIADLLCRYEDLKTTWRGQSEVWRELRKRLAQYRLAKQREQKAHRRTLWEAENTRKKNERNQARNERRAKERRGKQ